MAAFMFNRLHTIVFASLTLASSALAGVYITNPVANSTARPGELFTIRWVDDGTTPHLATIGPSKIALYTGSPTQQTFLQELAVGIDVSTSNSVDAWIDSNLGPNGEYYFIRITSNDLKDAVQLQYPYQSYSARFTLNNMSGAFNASVWQQLDTISSASATSTYEGTTTTDGQRSGTASSLSSSTGNSAESSTSSPSGMPKTAVTAAILGTSTASAKETSVTPTSSSRSSSLLSASSSLTASTTSSSSAAGTRLSAPFSFKAPQVLARANQPGSPEGRTAALMVTSVLVGVFGFGLAIAL